MMNLVLDCTAYELLRQILEHNSVHSVLYYLAELERFPEPEEFANAANKLLNKYDE